MGIFEVLSLMGGLSLFLFGMSIMSGALEKKAGSKLRIIIENVTKNKFFGLVTGLVITAIIQSSSATTVMVVGFVNSGIMTLKESISIIMGANIGTTVTSWILSLAGISSNNIFIKLLKPSSFTPILAFVGVIFYAFLKDTKKKDTGLILLGFATLMFGMEQMTHSVSSLKNVAEFRNLFVAFKNPAIGILAGAVLTAIIQSSSASVGILQALAQTGVVTYESAIPIIMGQNIGTCVTAIISSTGTTVNAKRASLIHLLFNIFGTTVFTILFIAMKYVLKLDFLDSNIDMLGIAVVHTLFNLTSTILIFPISNVFEDIVVKILKDEKKDTGIVLLDDRLMAAPAVAIEECRKNIIKMCELSVNTFEQSIKLITNYDETIKNDVINYEAKIDEYEDKIGTYLVKLSGRELTVNENYEVGRYLKSITDFERISDHSLNICEYAMKLKDDNKNISEDALKELSTMTNAVNEVLQKMIKAFTDNDVEVAYEIESLEQVVDDLEVKLKERHISRLQKGKCDLYVGFIYNDMLNDLERISDHSSNIAGQVLNYKNDNMNTHINIDLMKKDMKVYEDKYKEYSDEFKL